jgi:hypothetical protein
VNRVIAGASLSEIFETIGIKAGWSHQGSNGWKQSRSMMCHVGGARHKGGCRAAGSSSSSCEEGCVDRFDQLSHPHEVQLQPLGIVGDS